MELYVFSSDGLSIEILQYIVISSRNETKCNTQITIICYINIFTNLLVASVIQECISELFDENSITSRAIALRLKYEISIIDRLR